MQRENSCLLKLRRDAESIFQEGLAAVNAENAVLDACLLDGKILRIYNKSIDLSLTKNIYIIGAGKASAAMASAAESILGSRISKGVVSVKYGHTSSLDRVKLIEAGHPVPDRNGLEAAEKILETAERAGESDLVICLLSGGGSALLPCPAEPLTLSDKQETIRALLDSGAGINEINAIRKHMSCIKGGLLARRAYPAHVLTLIVSDVVGDKLDVIASGPTVPDSSTFSDCIQIIISYSLENRIPARVMEHMENGASGLISETPGPEESCFERACSFIVASSRAALKRAGEHAESLGYNTMLLSSVIEGDTREAARFHAAVAKEIRISGCPVKPPACLLSGGETTVFVAGKGTGGRNQEFALASALEIREEDGIVVLSGGTDGTDGPTDAAGAVVSSDTSDSACKAGLSAREYLENNDSYSFFKQTGELLVTGPTGSNVMDLRVVLVGL